MGIFIILWLLGTLLVLIPLGIAANSANRKKSDDKKKEERGH